MMAKMNDAVIVGVDAGGSRTRARVARVQPDASGSQNCFAEIGYGEAGAGNPRAAGFELAQQNIQTAIRQATR